MVYKKAEEKLGQDLQIIKLNEECGELIQIMSKFLISRSLSGNPSKNHIFGEYIYMENIVDEIADVKIMLEQFEAMFDLEDKVKEQMARKIQRFYVRLSGIHPEGIYDEDSITE